MAHTFVILGASGDLTHRKLVPALYHLYRKGRLPKDTRIIGFSRTAFTHDEWRSDLAKAVARFVGKDFDQALWEKFAPNIYYQPGDIGKARRLHGASPSCSKKSRNQKTARAFTTSPPRRNSTGRRSTQLGAAGLADENGGKRRVIIEKPFGTDLASAKKLNAVVHAVFSEKQVYRIDHYLGKETVQNLLVLRFANTIFEPIWNRRYIDHVQITVAEEVDVGRRAGYYDTAGVMRDMFQNHLLQLVMITAMEAPVRYEADAVRNEKVKVLQAIRPMTADEVHRDTLRGQYRGYQDAEGVPAGSRNATFAAVKLSIDNWRWQGVPFYLAQRQSDVVPHDSNRRAVSRAAPHAVPRRARKASPMPTVSSFKCSLPRECSCSSKPKFLTRACGSVKLRSTSATAANSAASFPRRTSVCCSTRSKATPACSPAQTKSKPPGQSAIRFSKNGNAAMNRRCTSTSRACGARKNAPSGWPSKAGNGSISAPCFIDLHLGVVPSAKC